MNQYDFSNLSPSEFEMLVRDLLQAKYKIQVESFAEGQDRGIDLRFKDEGGDCIVQCKRYSSFDNLMGALKRETSKVLKLNPKRYIIATSLELSPEQKSKVQSLFSTYIKDTTDILSRSDLNNLLTQYPEVERSYYKLWLTSAAVLDRIVNAQVYYHGQLQLQQIREQATMYVQNPSFNQALELIRDHNYVLISGEPGIGKSTLAYMLVYYLLSKGYDQFVYLSETVTDAYKITTDKPTVYLFDDFLGTNFMKTQWKQNEDNRLLQFIEWVEKSKKDVLILVTREYILKQAKDSFGKLGDPKFELSKCVLDVGKYTSVIKAQILYNHLFFNGLPQQYIEALLRDEFYMKLIYHDNFNPRIIEAIIDKDRWTKVKPEEFAAYFKKSFDHPHWVWQDIYESEISALSQYALAILGTFDSVIYLDDFEKAVQAFVSKTQKQFNLEFNPISFNKILRQLENTFIKLTIDNKGRQGIEFQNASIKDFIRNYLSEPSHSLMVREILLNAPFLDQLTEAVTTKEEKKEDEDEFSFIDPKLNPKIKITDLLVKELQTKLIEEFTILDCARLSTYEKEKKDGFYWGYSGRDDYSKLVYLVSEPLYNGPSGDYHYFIILKMQQLLSFEKMDYWQRSSFKTLFKTLHLHLTFNPTDIANRYAKSMDFLSDWSFLTWLNEQYPGAIEEFINNKTELNRAYKKTVDFILLFGRQVYAHELDELKEIGLGFGIDVSNEMAAASKKIKSWPMYRGGMVGFGMFHSKPIEPIEDPKSGEKIRQMFSSLLKK